MTADSKNLEVLPKSEVANLPAKQERRAFFGVVPNLPHENEPDFLILRDEFAAELTADGLLFGHQIAHELAVARRNINRYRQASIACLDADSKARPHATPIKKGSFAWMRQELIQQMSAEEREKLEARTPGAAALPPCYEQMRDKIDALIDPEMRRYQEDSNLMSGLSQNHKLLQAMGQNAIDVGATNQKVKGRLLVEYAGKPPNKYLTDERKFTDLSQSILDEPPLLQGESCLDYETILLDAMEFCGADSVTELIAAQDTANDTLQINRLLQQREQKLASAFSLEMERERERRNRAAKFRSDRVPAASQANGADDLIDPRLVLAAALHKNFEWITHIDRQIDRIRYRRRRTMENVMKRRASRLRLMSAHSRGMKLIK
jgi:hypothetical protein